MNKKFLTLKETAQYLCISRSTLYRFLKNPDFPRPIRISKKIVVFDIDDINRWMESQKTKTDQ